MGTYSGIWNLFSISGAIVEQVDGFDTKTKETLNNHITESGTVVYSIPISGWISLDGNPAIAFEGLPAGFEFLDMGMSNNESGAFTTSMGFYERGSSSDAAKAISTWGVHSLTENCSTVSPTVQNISGIAISGITLKVTDFLSAYSVDLSTTLNIGSDASLLAMLYKNLKTTGNYDIYASITTDGSTVWSGKKSKLFAPSKLDLISALTAYAGGVSLGTATITSSSATELDFTWPSMGATTGPVSLVATEFGGRTYVASPFVIILNDPSGLYVIVPGKTNDTLYIDHGGGTTQNVAIPTPFAKTGFIDG